MNSALRPSPTLATRARGARVLRLFLRFASAGAVGTAAHYALLVATVSIFAMPPLWGSVAGSFLGATINYALNYSWTFASKAPHRHTLPRFIVVAALGLAINAGSMYLLVNVAAIQYFVAQLATTAVVLLLGFALNAGWAFGRPR